MQIKIFARVKKTSDSTTKLSAATLWIKVPENNLKSS
jgi:hypothetical protein